MRFVEETIPHAWLGATSGELYYWKKGSQEDLFEAPGPRDPLRILTAGSSTFILARNGLFEWRKGEDPGRVFSFDGRRIVEVLEAEEYLFLVAEDAVYRWVKSTLGQPEVFELPKVEYPRTEETLNYFWLMMGDTLRFWKKGAEERPVEVPEFRLDKWGAEIQEISDEAWISSGHGISRWRIGDPDPPAKLDLPDVIDLENGMVRFKVMATSKHIWMSVEEMEFDYDTVVARRRWLLSFEKGRPEEIRIRRFPFGHLHEVFEGSTGFWLHTSKGLVRISAEA